MQEQSQSPKITPQASHDERILVVRREILFAHAGAWQGLNTSSFDELLPLIKAHQEFHPRSLMETDPTYKQIIPYLVFTHKNKYFLMQRRDQASEQRLKNKYSLGIGGHIREEDITSTDIMGWAKREFHEEVHYEDTYTVKPLGILNDDSNPVGQVHIGFVLLIEGSTDTISIASELKSGHLYTLEECETFYPQMEAWSQVVFETLKRY